ncbi:Deoxycytidylate deaminase [Colletotrichum chlorophyti]|uniref:Deoxycytidylate deaminase n=1 Tax=Colletotrichum chlorophyti TaxID=708187 RepID=A0A1Q8RMG6_9PEZI|nr:Deoxycytidylate deaminase [Colletotrichum chlorophyti]
MLIGICGGICSGKKTVAQYLVEHHGFKLLRLEDPSPTPQRSETPVPNVAAEPAPQYAPSGHLSTESESQQQSKKKKKYKGNGSGVVCFICKEPGHVKSDCPTSSPAINGNNSHTSMVVRDTAPAAHTNGTFNPPIPPQLTFSSAEALVDYVTVRWQARFVTTDVHNEAILDVFSRRPFFMLISVDAPLTVRHARFRSLHNPHCTLESFALASDSHLYDPHNGLQPLISRATVRLLNTSSSLAHLFATLGKLQLADPVRLRPSWDAYFMSLATLASLRSNCMKRRVGAVLVGREKRVISTGYNGTPRGLQNCSDGGCSRCNSGNSSGVGLATCLCIHAEENALLEAGRERIREGAVLYCDTCPCLTCSIKICQVGIEEVVYAHGYSMDTETAAVFRQAGPPNGLIHLENLEKMELY